MKMITTEQELIENLKTLEYYLVNGNEDHSEKTTSLVKDGTCFVAYHTEEEIRFAPSRFIGYLKNTLDKHDRNSTKHGSRTNQAISKVLSNQPVPNKKLESEYKIYCTNLGISPNKTGAFGHERKFWLLKIDSDFEENLEMTEDFPEGKIVERKHKARERNSKVTQIAKSDFKTKHGRLCCEICDFDFQEHYGELGKDFIEAHHTIPVSEMTDGDTTRPEDIALLCSNCHRMVHKRRPWLSIKELRKIKKTAPNNL